MRRSWRQAPRARRPRSPRRWMPRGSSRACTARRRPSRAAGSRRAVRAAHAGGPEADRRSRHERHPRLHVRFRRCCSRSSAWHLAPALMTRAARRAHVADRHPRRTGEAHGRRSVPGSARHPRPQARNHGVPPAAAIATVDALLAVEVGDRRLRGAHRRWVRADLARAILPFADEGAPAASSPPAAPDTRPDPLEDAVLAAMAARTRPVSARQPTLEWESDRTTVPIRRAPSSGGCSASDERQRGLSLDEAIAGVVAEAGSDWQGRDRRSRSVRSRTP